MTRGYLDVATGEWLGSGPGSWSDDEWESFIREANPTSAIVERARRIFTFFEHCRENHGSKGGSRFSAFMAQRFGMAQSLASRWCRIGKQADELIHITNKFSPDWSAFYEFTKLAPDLQQQLLAGPDLISQKTIKALTADTREKETAAILQANPPEIPTGLYVGDFREYAKQIPDESIELIFTDPPYDRESIPLFADLAQIAARVLRPGGSLIAYCGQIQLPHVLSGMAEHLRYWWVNACVHSGKHNQMDKYGIKNGWKPMVWFVKGTRGDVQTFVEDTVTGAEEKSHHAWQQAESEAAYYIERLCSPSGIVWEPFGGGGTTIAACESLGRKWIACEINPASAARIADRLRERKAA
jgi:hypothetical protein